MIIRKSVLYLKEEIKVSYFITCDELAGRITDFVLIDVRSAEAYESGHIKGAHHFGSADFKGEGRFFPKAEDLAEKLGKAGIDEDTALVIYDDGSNRLAAKAWVTLYYLGHEKMQILSRGIAAWDKAGYLLTDELPKVNPVTYHPKVNESVDVQIDEVKEKMGDESSVLIDSRGYERYIGEKEPKYAKAGHIPGAKNYMSKDVVEDGAFRSRAELEAHFEPVKDADEVIVSCGTGTSACLNFVALKEAGFSDVKIFAGGFKEWIDEGNEIKTEDET